LDPEGTNADQNVEQVDRSCARLKERLVDWAEQNSHDVPRVLIDEAQRSPYKSIGETHGPLDRINIRTATGDLVDLEQRSSIVAALKPFKLFRVYVSEDDVEARKAIEEIVNGELAR
jgi:hypothetical protein